MEFARPSSSLKRFTAIALAFLTCVLVTFVFTPRVAIWQGLGLYSAQTFPEVNRANVTLRQLADPYGMVESESNQVVKWRLFFPFVGNLLGVPSWAFLALPHVGCVLVLVFVARLLLARSWRPFEVGAALTVLATSAWFFVSSGWLAYFDSWCALGMLLVAFARNRMLMIGAVLISPWVDERFVFALPLSLMVRREFLGEPSERRIGDVVLCALALTPWVVCRMAAFTWFDDPVTAHYTESMWERRESLLARSHLSGAWHGLRWGWVLVLAAVMLARKARVLAGIAALALMVVFALADDLSRATIVILPLVVLGALRLRDRSGAKARPVLLSLAALNLLFPAKHVIADWEVPIYYLYREIERMQVPPVELDPNALNDSAVARFEAGDQTAARGLFNSALALAPDHLGARTNRGVMRMKAGHWGLALADFEHALTLAPRDPKLLHLRARARLQRGDREGARDDLKLALSEAPPNWSLRHVVTKDLQLLEAQN